MGDSFSANCHTIAATAFGTQAYGYAGAIAVKTGLFPSYLDNQGKVGDHSGQFMPRLPSCLTSLATDLWMLLSRTNDSTTLGMTLADSKANVMKVITAFQNTPGKHLIVETGTPRFGTKALTGQALTDAIAYKDWVLGSVRQFVQVVNIWDGFTMDMTVDDLHPNLIGADFIHSRCVPVINANPLMTGAGGVISASVDAVPGSVLADTYKASGSGLSGITTKLYKEQAAFGEAQCIELAGTMPGAGGYIYLQPTASVTLSNLSANDVIEVVSARRSSATVGAYWVGRPS